MKIARVFVATDLIMAVLAFPEGATVKACLGERAPLGEIELIVEHDDLPDVPDGHEIPIRKPILTLLDADKKRPEFISFDWGTLPDAELKDVETRGLEASILRRFYQDVCQEAELKMEKTGKLEGAHYAAMRSLLNEKGVMV